MVLTAARLRELLDYDPETGVFKWVKITSNRVKVGAVAGTPSNGYWLIAIDGVLYYAHRLAWLYVYGVLPKDEIDHRNRDRADNRIENLREATHAQNMRNLAPRRDSLAGVRGVYFDRSRQKWAARIKSGQVHKTIGRYECFGRAVSARREASLALHGEFAGRA